MLVKVKTIAFSGIECLKVTVEVNISSRGLPYFDIVGLPAKSVEESKHRVKAAFQNCDLEFPNKRITVNLAPADIHKEGSFYDLPIAVGILCAVYNLKPGPDSLFFGEVGLDGSLRHTKGSFLLSIFAKENKYRKIFVPQDCINEASSVRGVGVFGVNNLIQMLEHLEGSQKIIPAKEPKVEPNFDYDNSYSFNRIIGQEYVKRALIISAAGGHNILMLGPPGSGKTLLARSLTSILPPLTEEESISVTKIYSSMGMIPPNGTLVKRRPFRSPHHTTSYAGMVGGGNTPTPGEITLAHRGILFMDEFSEYQRPVLEALRQPMEDGEVTISRSRLSTTFPAKFTLVAASNPCPCGYLGHPKKDCKCSPANIRQYRKKISGPILDRIDLYVNVKPVDLNKMSVKNLRPQNPVDLAEIVYRTRELQLKRYKKENILTNSEMRNKHISKYCHLTNGAESFLKQISMKMNLSARSYFKIVKISQTIADLASSDNITQDFIAEAFQYRSDLY